ncbi:hypothetical protein [Sphingomonas sp.]|uniref:hypothetical protein n=1 Tax=Sphingomonas sp. TaxID=28214 RepID=UPI0031DFF426
MEPDEVFDRLTAGFTLNMVAHMARILERAGLMDDETRDLIHRQLPILAEVASRCDDNDTRAEHLDLLVSILPARRAPEQ